VTNDPTPKIHETTIEIKIWMNKISKVNHATNIELDSFQEIKFFSRNKSVLNLNDFLLSGLNHIIIKSITIAIRKRLHEFAIKTTTVIKYNMYSRFKPY